MPKVIKKEINRIMNGLPKFFGGKRKFVKLILAKSVGTTFADGFLGGGSVALYAKVQGFSVLCNDISFLSEQIGRAYIENNSMKLDNDDINRLFVPAESRSNFILKHYAPNTFTTRHAKFFDNARFWIEKTNNPTRRNLLYCFLAKFILDVRPYGNFSTTYLSELAEQLDRCPADKIPEHSMIKSVSTIFTTPIYFYALKVMEKVNQSVLTNGKRNYFFRKDIFDFVDEIDADTLYLDPPYTGAASYEDYYGVLNSCLKGCKIKSEKSVFNKEDGFKFLDKLLSKCGKFKRLILSFGCEKYTVKEIYDLFLKYRPNAELLEIPSYYSVGVKDGKTPVKTEILLIG